MGGLVAEHAAALGAPMDGLVASHHLHTAPGPLPVALWPIAGDEGDGDEQCPFETISAYLRSVEAITGPRPPILVVTAAKDRLVPKSASRPNRAHTVLEVSQVGHVIFDQGAADAILEWATDLIKEVA